jgi:hypothetical protein
MYKSATTVCLIIVFFFYRRHGQQNSSGKLFCLNLFLIPNPTKFQKLTPVQLKNRK